MYSTATLDKTVMTPEVPHSCLVTPKTRELLSPSHSCNDTQSQLKLRLTSSSSGREDETFRALERCFLVSVSSACVSCRTFVKVSITNNPICKSLSVIVEGRSERESILLWAILSSSPSPHRGVFESTARVYRRQTYAETDRKQARKKRAEPDGDLLLRFVEQMTENDRKESPSAKVFRRLLGYGILSRILPLLW